MNEIQQIDGPRDFDQIAPLVAEDLAQGLLEMEEIARRHGLTMDTVERLRTSKSFRKMVLAAQERWTNPGNTKLRAQTKAQLAVEDLILTMVGIVNNPKEAGTARVSAFQALKELGKFEKAPEAEQRAAGGGFSVTINFGDGQGLSVSAQPDVQTIEGVSENVEDG